MPLKDMGEVKLNYEVSGEGPPVVLIPGWTLNLHFWDLVLPEVERFFKVIRYDPRGSGMSSQESEFEYSRVADAEDLKALMGQLGIGSAHLVGHSKGARIAFTFAMMYPGAALSVTGIGSAEPHGDEPDEKAPRARIYSWVQHLREIALKSGAGSALAEMKESKERPLGPVRMDAERFWYFKKSTSGYTAADLFSTVPHRQIDPEAGSANLTMPVLLICGDSDPFLGECEYARSKISGAVLEVIQGCGHYPPIEVADTFSKILISFLLKI